MGFRSTLVGQDYSGNLPKWFKDKYKNILFFGEGVLIASQVESKHYTNDLFEDYQKSLIETDFFEDFPYDISIVVLAEDGFVSKVLISVKEIKYYWLSYDDGLESDHVWCQG